MGLWKPRPQPERIIAFGKLPWAPDFLRHGLTESEGKLVDWVERGMEWARVRQGADWPRQFLSAAACAFAQPLGDRRSPDRLLIGVLEPSRDGVGRLFPWVILTTIPYRAALGAPHVLPLWAGDFLEAAHAVSERLQRAERDVTQELAGLIPPDPADLARHEADYRTWAGSASMSSLWSVVFGEPTPNHAWHAIRTLVEAVVPLRGQESPETPLGIRVPLGTGGPAAAAFWLDVIRRAGRWRRSFPCAFWPADASSLLVHFGPAPDSTLAQLVLPDLNSDVVCDVTSATSVRTESFLGQLPGPIQNALEQPEQPVTNLLEVVGA